VRGNSIVSTVPLAGLPLRTLNLDDNNVSQPLLLETLDKLMVLSLPRNGLTDLGTLGSCRTLQRLDVSENYISGLRSVELIGDLSRLAVLDLRGNPCCGTEDVLTPNYRERVIARMPQIVSLDGEIVTEKHKISYTNACEFPGCDLPSRKKTWAANVTEEAWSDYHPPIVELDDDPQTDCCPATARIGGGGLWAQETPYIPNLP